MPDLPVLMVYLSLFDEESQTCYIRSRLSQESSQGVLGTRPDVDGRLCLPFPLGIMPHIQRILNMLQSPKNDREKRLFEKEKKIEEALMELELLDDTGRIIRGALPWVGTKIGHALLTNAEFQYNLDAFYVAAREQGGDIVFNFEATALKLAAIPWELACDKTKRPLLRHPHGEYLLSCTRVILDGRQSSLHPRTTALRVLAVASYVGIDGDARALEKEARRNLKDALNSLQSGWSVDDHTGLNGHVSWKDLERYLRENDQKDVLDYYGHGSLDDQGVATLSMYGDDNSQAKISAVQLMALQRLPHLLVFHVCHSAEIDIRNVQSSLAPILSSHDSVDAVVAMQGEIQMRIVAEYVTPALYQALAEHESLPRAVARVRQRLFNGVSWFVPVLYMRQFSQDPYIPGVPLIFPENPFREQRAVKDAQFFVGCRKQIRDIGKWLQADFSLALTGPTGCGKTSMLKYLADQLNKDEMLELGKEVYIVQLDVEVEMKVKEAEAYIVEKIGVRGEKLEDLLKKKALILLLDDLDVLNPHKSMSFLTRLKNLLTRNVQMVITMQESMKGGFAQHSKHHALFAQQAGIEEIELKPFILIEARAFVVERLKRTPFKVEQFEECLREKMTPAEVETICRVKYDELKQPSF